MLQDINQHIALIDGSIAWAKEFGKESFPYEVFKEYRRKLRRIYAALEENCPELFTAMGFGLTPQFRFGANNKISFIVGCDFIFDFGFSTSREVYNIDRYLISMPEAEINKFFRFGITPQVGFGINF